MQNKRLNFR